MNVNKDKFINIIKNEIFALDKELNFGIYKIYKQSEKQIEKLLKEVANVDDEIKEDIYNYLYNFFSLYYEGGDFGYTQKAFATFTVPYTYKEFQIKDTKECFKESSSSFFYDGKETKFTWRTEDSYYVKSNRYFNNVTINIENINITFRVEDTDEDFDRNKGRLFRLLKAKKDNNKITLYFNISNTQTPKHSIYLFVKNLIEIDEAKKELEYVANKDFENIPSSKILFDGFEINKYSKYLYTGKDSKFKNKTSKKNEDKFQIYSFLQGNNSLYITKKAYAKKVYNITVAKQAICTTNFDFDNNQDVEKLYREDKLLNFFHKLDRGFNNFLVGVNSDYFIHKNLKRFLLVELDKFIKNYILSDTKLLLELNKDTQILLKKAKIFKEKAEKVIEFLSAVEEFQKYIWEKRKLIKKIDYIVSSNRLDEPLLQIVLRNERQIDEWIELKICDKKPSLKTLQENSYPIDTKYFSEIFKIDLLSQFENLDEETDGILLKSENFQALKFLEKKYKEQIKCIYIDPPYNTGSDGFIYKDNYQEASWLSMMSDRLKVAKKLMREDGVIFSSIDNNETNHLYNLLNNNFNLIDNISLQVKAQSGDSSKLEKPFIDLKEDIYFASKSKNYSCNNNLTIIKEYIDENSKTINQYNHLLKNLGKHSNKSFSFTIDKDKTEIEVYEVENFIWERIPVENKTEKYYLENINKIVRTAAFSGEFKKQFKDKKDGVYYFEYKITRGKNKGKTAQIYIVNGEQLIFLKDVSAIIEKKNKKRLVKLEKLSNIWNDISYTGIAKEGKVELKNGKKPEKLLERIINLSIPKNLGEWVLDFFGGSGTTAAVAYKMNKKFITCEINDYFEELLLKRMKYAMFGNDGGSIKSQKDSGLIQYIYLQQYEDIIENLNIKAKDVDIEAKYIFNPLKNEINKVNIQPKLETLFSFIYHRGFHLQHIKKENNLLIAECEEGIIILDNMKCLEELDIDKYDKKIYTNIKPKSNFNPFIQKVEIVTSEDFKGI